MNRKRADHRGLFYRKERSIKEKKEYSYERILYHG